MRIARFVSAVFMGGVIGHLAGGCSQPIVGTDSGPTDAPAAMDVGPSVDTGRVDVGRADTGGADTGRTDACAPTTLCRDADDDAFGDSTMTMTACIGSVAGYVPTCGDCDDDAMQVNPGAPEQPCNATDDDCDVSTTDDASAEVCDGLPNDCDAAVDEGFGCVLGTSRPCATSCDPGGTMTGTQTCGAGCSYGGCVAPTETCNGRDDDCNGTADDAPGLACVRDATVACTTSCGSTGSGTCTAACSIPTGAACIAPGETCNGADDDCDAIFDEPGCRQNQTGLSCTTGCGTGGLQDCNASCSLTTCRALTETCNACDDDADTRTDEGLGCIRGSTVGCTDGCGGGGGTGTCTTSCTVPSGFPACRPVRDDTYNRTQFFHACGFDLAGAHYTWCGDAACIPQYGPGPLVAYPQGNYRITFALRADGPGPQTVELLVRGAGVSALRDDPADGIGSAGAGGSGSIRYSLGGSGAALSPSLLFTLNNACNSSDLEFIVSYVSSGSCSGTSGGLVISSTRVTSM